MIIQTLLIEWRANAAKDALQPAGPVENDSLPSPLNLYTNRNLHTALTGRTTDTRGSHENKFHGRTSKRETTAARGRGGGGL